MKGLNGFQEVEASECVRSLPMMRRRAVSRRSQCVSPPALLPSAIMSTVIFAFLLITTIGFIPQAHAQHSPGDILVINSNAGTNRDGALFRVNPTTGNRTVVSDFGDNAQGPLGSSPHGVVLDASGSILVLDISAGTDGVLFRVNPTTGSRTVLSDFGDTNQGSLGAFPFGLALDALGDILVIDSSAGTNGDGALFRVNPTTGNRTLVSDFGDNAQGPLGSSPNGVALDASGSILVTDNSVDALFRVNSATGNRTILSDFGNFSQGELGVTPTAVALDASGNILVIDSDAGTNGIGVLFRVNPATGNRTVVSDFGDNAQGPLGSSPSKVVLDASGSILVTDFFAGTNVRGTLFRVNPANGNRTVVSDFSDNTQGPLGSGPSGVAIVPPQPRLGDILVLDSDAGENFTNGALFSVNPFDGGRVLISNFGIRAQGPLGANPSGVATEASGTILVTDFNRGMGGIGALFRVNPATGNRTVVSDFGDSNQGPLGQVPIGVAVVASGRILVIARDAGTDGRGALFRVNPTTGNRTVVSDFGDTNQGPLGGSPSGVATEASGNILVIDGGAGTDGALFRVNPANGNRTVVSDFGDTNQGPLGGSPFGLALDALGNILVIDRDAGPNGRGALFTVDPRRLMHIDPCSLDRSGRFRRESTAISTLSPKETWPWTSISKPSWWHCTSSWTIFTRATSYPVCPPVVVRRHR